MQPLEGGLFGELPEASTGIISDVRSTPILPHAAPTRDHRAGLRHSTFQQPGCSTPCVRVYRPVVVNSSWRLIVATIPPAVLSVSADRAAFLHSHERNQQSLPGVLLSDTRRRRARNQQPRSHCPRKEAHPPPRNQRFRYWPECRLIAGSPSPCTVRVERTHRSSSKLGNAYML